MYCSLHSAPSFWSLIVCLVVCSDRDVVSLYLNNLWHVSGEARVKLTALYEWIPRAVLAGGIGIRKGLEKGSNRANRPSVRPLVVGFSSRKVQQLARVYIYIKPFTRQPNYIQLSFEYVWPCHPQ